MKKIFTVLVLALAMSFAFTGCASKKANQKGPKIYRVDIGSVLGSAVNVGEVNTINVSSLFTNEKMPAAGDTVRVMWSFVSDSDIEKLYVSLAEDTKEYVLAQDVVAEEPKYYVVNIPVEEDLTGTFSVSFRGDSEAICETAYIDAK